ncbi:hypothetical protein D2A34_22020 [Clostridium chromiireducens]|uniref:Uncharacterized protein n=1 Tax=Clostridium chromiireducens TaxID=225345 RepID=A0A399IIN1_9CLOT|nr:hypothetical protein [Clostridium chromiireducens]RII32874.1 hypothetical protein D2A34_22020 [Clostridium chromiireducens]
MKELIQKLREIYADTNFIESNRDGHKVLIYDNEELEWDEQFISVVIELAQECLSPEELKHFTFLYDYLNEISMCNSTEQVFSLDYIKSERSECIRKQLELFDLVTVDVNINVKTTNKLISKVVENLKFKSKQEPETFIIASHF